MQTEFFHERSRFVHQFFKSFFAVFGRGVLHHFHLVELMPADHAALFRAVRARFLAITRRVGEIFHRELRLVDDLARVHVDERRFRRGQHKMSLFTVFAFVADPVNFVQKFRELPRTEPAVIAEHMRRQNEFVTVFEVFGNKEIQKRPFEPRAHAAVQPVAAARKLDAAFVIDEPQLRAKIHVVFRLEGKFRL